MSEPTNSEGNNKGNNKDNHSLGADKTYQCRVCGHSYEFTGERIVCYGADDNSHKANRVEVVRPCGICGNPITTGEICSDCGNEKDDNAFTTNWG